MNPQASPSLDPSAGDARWLEQARRGSPEALGHVLELCRRYLLQIANSELDSHLQAKLGASDVVQETFLEAQRIFDRFDGNSPDELRAWLRAILLNKMSDQDRHYRGTAKRDLGKEITIGTSGAGIVEPLVPTPTPSNVMMQQERAVALTAALERLPAHYRQVIVWRQIEDMSFEEMASRLLRSVDAVRKLWWRAIQHLQEELGNSL
ncbi:MAG TPA: sigma-70 family RNA polymerase sigma factor [Pirellulaceae bacterium]|nr:sigma-70 family RNA polymerase sigma factor [Pirellulaceae bacterium]